MPLTPVQTKVYEFVRRSKHAVSSNQIIHAVYSDRIDGGPLQATKAVHVQICQMNKRLKLVGQRIGASRRGAASSYRLHHDVV